MNVFNPCDGSKYKQMHALFECPICGCIVEKPKSQGLKSFTCSKSCAAKYARKKKKEGFILEGDYAEITRQEKAKDKPGRLYACNHCNSYLHSKDEPCKRCNRGVGVQVWPYVYSLDKPNVKKKVCYQNSNKPTGGILWQ